MKRLSSSWRTPMEGSPYIFRKKKAQFIKEFEKESRKVLPDFDLGHIQNAQKGQKQVRKALIPLYGFRLGQMA